MNVKDRKILGELVINSRIPMNRLAKKVGISREVAMYRVRRLVEQEIITGFHAVIEETSLGYSRNTCFVQLKGISLLKEKKFLDFLKNHKSVTYMGTTIGKWNVIFDIISKNRNDLSDVVRSIQDKVKDNISIFAIAGNTISGGYYPEKIFESKKISPKNQSVKTKIDKMDLKILKLLTKDSRIEYSQLSRKLNLTANAIKYRIKNLESSRIISGYTISTDIKKLDYIWYNIQIKLIAGEKEIKDFLKKEKRVIYHYHYIGNENWDIDIGVIIRNSEELRDFIIKFREKFPEFVRIHDVYVILEILKENILPDVVFE